MSDLRKAMGQVLREEAEALRQKADGADNDQGSLRRLDFDNARYLVEAVGEPSPLSADGRIQFGAKTSLQSAVEGAERTFRAAHEGRNPEELHVRIGIGGGSYPVPEKFYQEFRAK